MSLFDARELKNLTRYVRGYLGGLRSLCLDLDGEEFKYLEAGSGETVVFLHGSMGSKTQWRSLMQAYSGDYHVVALDIPGLYMHQNFSGRPHTLRQLTAWLEQVLDRLRLPRVHLVCHSLGAAVGAYFAATRPGRVSSLLLMSFPDIFARQGEPMRQLVSAINLMLETNDVDALAGYYRSAFADPPAVPRIVLRYTLREAQKKREPALQAMCEFAASSPLLMAQLPQIEVPVLVVDGECDHISPLYPESFYRRNLPQCEYHLLPQCGHMVHLERAEELMGLHRGFLLRLDRRREHSAEPQCRLGVE